ncbi:MAG: HpaII family restriction endonuclease [Paludibacteraceae bacterium]|nr:HpaII family restriction endonuclease [Paludibacteraceae bacterium]
MPTKGNKGEWSEIYTLFRLLGDSQVYAGDANLNKLDLFYPILNIIRQEQVLYEYKPNRDRKIVIINEDGHKYASIPISDFIREADYLLEQIKNGKESAFEIPKTECFMHKIGCKRLKAPSNDKSDIHIVIHDLRTQMSPCLGFSIKSQLGSPSTLLNAGNTTNITYKVTGEGIREDKIAYLNNIEEHTKRMEEFLKCGFSLEYVDIDNSTFKNNLLFIDYCMPIVLANCLLCCNLSKSSSSIKETIETIANDNPLNIDSKNLTSFYEHKMKQLLISSALGMTPAKEWNGKFDANGGYLVVKKDGDIVCYHFYNINDVEDYLYNNTHFENASRHRYGFGSFYKEDDGNTYLKLNVQIRFNK